MNLDLSRYKGELDEQKTESLSLALQRHLVIPGRELTTPLPKDKIQEENKKIIESLTALLTHIPFPLEGKNYELVKERGIEQFFNNAIGIRYNEISKEILNLKRGMNYAIEDDGSLYELQLRIPVLFFGYVDSSVKSNDNDPNIVTYKVNPTEGYVTRKEREYGSDKGKRALEKRELENIVLDISSRIPPLTFEVKEKIREAYASCYQVYAEALSAPIIGDILSTGKSDINGPERARVGALWKPALENIAVNVEKPSEKNKDPALILGWHQRFYLVSTWNTKDEEPFQHYLQEFGIN